MPRPRLRRTAPIPGRLGRSIGGASVLAATALLLAGCASSTTSGASANTPEATASTAPTPTTSSAPPASSASSTPPASSGSGSLTPASGTATDDVFGNSITVEGYEIIPGTKLPASLVSQYAILDGGSLTVIKVKIGAASKDKYYTTDFPDTVEVTDATGDLTGGSDLGPLQTEAANLGYSPAIDLSSANTLPTEGYLLYTTNRVPTSLTVTMNRQSAGVSDGSTISAKSWTVATLG